MDTYSTGGCRCVAAAPWVVLAVTAAFGFYFGLCDLGDAECTDAENERIRRLSVVAEVGFAVPIPAAIVLLRLRRTGVWLLVLVVMIGAVVVDLLAR